ncbi:trefoil factor 2-like [Eleutherodactylus coqui]|uniref:trefoil factor 2-like n=1 Tax=Eleutherodactylus coqui TaxID=57060 RepID=UPI0034621D6D
MEGYPRCYFPKEDPECDLNPKLRMLCGSEEISEDDCKKIGCCFDPSMEGNPLCYYSKKVVCDVKKKQACGDKDISESECKEKGCCFDPSLIDEPTCYFPRKLE